MRLNYFNYKRFDDHFLLTNDFGKFSFLTGQELKQLLKKNIIKGSDLWNRLYESKMVFDDTEIGFSSENRYDLRELKSHVSRAASLHIFVVTTACNLNCAYCQANNGKDRPHLFMDIATAEHAVTFALQSPEEHLSFEFQGGEPLLNFGVIKHIVEISEKLKGFHKISYNLVSNLTLITSEMLDFFVEHNFGISTSIDGSEDVHNRNRPFLNGDGSFDQVVESVQKVRNAGITIGAIETTTKYSLQHPEEIVRSYFDLGFNSIFVRPLTPLGKATVNWPDIGYTPEQFLCFYQRAFEEVLRINQEGSFFREAHAEILLRKMHGQAINFMELRSPCGASIGQVAYFADGSIFTCDEGRMLYEMGVDAFRLGSVLTDNYSDIIKGSVCRTVCASSILETIPSCCDCVYQPYCGTCPVVNYAHSGDLIQKEPRGYRCRIYCGMLDNLFRKYLENDESTVKILNAWSN